VVIPFGWNKCPNPLRKPNLIWGITIGRVLAYRNESLTEVSYFRAKLAVLTSNPIRILGGEVFPMVCPNRDSSLSHLGQSLILNFCRKDDSSRAISPWSVSWS
jgi:hypothetical protein